jgi:predicted Rossmann fold nucleotide-binding protein DprA/Smf involved in DNA uptake
MSGMPSERTPQLEAIPRGDARYPAALALQLADQAPVAITACGNLAIFPRRTLALFCSVKCPGTLILQAYDVACALREAGATVIGGFHSPMEKECLTVLLRGSQPVIICPPRSLERMHLPAAWQTPLANGRLLVLSPFPADQRRPTADLAQARNRFVASLAHEIFIAHDAPGGKTEAFAATILSWGKPLYTLEGSDNAGLISLGAQVITPEAIRKRWSTRGEDNR